MLDAALRSPFFGLSGDGVAHADLVGRAFAILQSLHGRRRVEPPIEVIAGLFADFALEGERGRLSRESRVDTV